MPNLTRNMAPSEPQGGLLDFVFYRIRIVFFVTLVAMGIPNVTLCQEVVLDTPPGWTDYVIPLPKKMNITGSVQVHPNKIWLSYDEKSFETSATVIQSMLEFFRKHIGIPLGTAAPIGGEGFEIRFVLCDPNGKVAGADVQDFSDVLRASNSDQAYRIFSENRRLTVVANGPQGLQYGAITLQQLILPFITQQSGTKLVKLPIMSVLDWPDLAERGFWGHHYDRRDIKWFSEHKLNLVELYVYILIKDMGIDSNGKGWVRMDSDLITYARRNGVKVVPIIFHIDQLQNGAYPSLKDMYQRYPDMKVKYPYKNPSDYYPCGSSERFINVLTDWLTAMAADQHVSDISVWLSEWGYTSCACEQCRTLGRQRSEAKAVVTAWERVRQSYPHKHLWLLPCGGYSGDVLSVVPTGSNIHVVEYNYSLKSGPIVPEVLSEHASRKEWIGAYPLFSGSSDIVFPSHLASLIHYRMGEFNQKSVRKVAGYTGLSSVGLYEFNMAAAAEWSWNKAGRSVKEFAFAYAKKHQFMHPEEFAEWVSKIELVEQKLRSIYSFDKWFPKSEVKSIEKNTILFGHGPLMNYGNYSQLLDDWHAIGECEALASKIDRKDIVFETAIVKGYLRLLMIYAETDTKLNSCSLARANEVSIEISDAATVLSESLDGYYSFVGNPGEKSFLRKSQVMLKDNVRQIAESIKTYVASQCSEPAL